MKNIGEYIKSVRKSLNLTQRELGELLGKNRSDIAKYETNRAMPPGNVILHIQKLIALKNDQTLSQ